MKNVLQFIALSMAVFSDAYYSEGKNRSKLFTSIYLI